MGDRTMSKPYIIENVSLQIEGTQSKIEEMEDFHKSYYGKEFFQAFQVVAEILKQNKKIFERYREDGYENAVKLTQSQIHNIVPFIGKRGTGKTSAMVSFAGALKDYYKKYGENKEDIFFTFSKSNDISFTCLDCIDSSLLENGEDIFKVILAQMYGDFLRINRENLEKRDDDQRRKIQKKFDKVYKSICQLEVKTSKEDYWEESPIMSLKSLSSSLSIKMDFEELIQDYLKVVDKHRKAENHFLVIVIDDLDLNIDSGFDMLEKIHRYMMVPNVIILLAIDYDQLKLLCERHFYKIVPFVEEKIKEKSQEVENLAKDFLDKALPCHMRIYMPNLAKCQGITVIQDKENGLDLKNAVFQEIYEKLGMRMDVKGEKRHFFEQNSLRSYVNFYLMLKTMDKLNDQNLVIEKENKEFFSTYERNYKLLMSDITTRMVDERLNTNSKKTFFKITESRLPRSCRNLFSHINKIIDDMKIKEKTQLNSLEKNLKSLADIVDEYEYSYGEIMRIIYCWGRCDEQSKEIIRCLLAFYSLEMTRLYYYYRYESKGSDNNENRTKIFREILNGSFAGSWANKMMPLMKKEGTERFFNVGDRQKVMMEQVFQIKLSPKMKEQIKVWKEESSSTEDRKENIKKIFRSVLVLGMFFDQPYYKKQEQFRWDIQETETSYNSSKLKKDFLAATQTDNIIKNREGIGIFNIMNFVSNAFQYEENIIPLMNSLYQCLFGNKNNEKLKEEIKQEFEDWAKYCGAFALPIYDMDVSYNLLKRVRQRMYGQSINARTEKEILKETIDIYNFMSEQLKENDEKYETGMVHWEKWQHKEENYSGYKISMKDAFEYCPYIKWITNRNEYLVNEFDDWFASMLKELTVRGSSECKEDEKTKENEIRWMGYDD